MNTQPGPIVLLGSGETAPAAHKIYHQLFSKISEGGQNGSNLSADIRIAILETPAGFEPNSEHVAGEIAAYFEQKLQNFRPHLTVVPARMRGTPYSPEDPALAAQLHDANIIFMGPGSPTYAVRQLRETAVWDTLRACHRLGAALIFASAATLAISRLAMPVYEIYKVGEDLHWKPGLDLFNDFGLSAIVISHWNNNDGGKNLDTSRCYLGMARFETLLNIVPGGRAAYTFLGIDENTAVIIEPANGLCRVMGAGAATIMRGNETLTYPAGRNFRVEELGAFCLPELSKGIPEGIMQQVVQGRATARAARFMPRAPEADVLALLERRQQARSRKDWPESDQLRMQLAARGWRVLDTPDGQRLEPELGNFGSVGV